MISELEPIDSAVLVRLCETALDQGHDAIGNLEILDELKVQGLADSDITDALEILDERGLISAAKVLGRAYLNSSIAHATITLKGFDLFARHRFPNFDAIVGQVAGMIVNEEIRNNIGLVEKTNLPAMLIEHIVDLLENNGLIKVSKHFGGYFIHDVSPSLKRMLRS